MKVNLICVYGDLVCAKNVNFCTIVMVVSNEAKLNLLSTKKLRGGVLRHAYLKHCRSARVTTH